jgi:antitoxin component of MazEF toxin-antitoxin module
MNYSKVWNTMNDLEMVTCKIASAREILDSAMDRLQEHQYDKTETLLCAVDEFLQYYLEEFDTKFKDAWKETVLQLKQEENDAYIPFSCDKDDTSPLSGEHLQAKIQANSPYNDGWTREYYQEIVDKYEKKDKVVKWQLPVEEVKDSDTDETEYFITFPDDLLEAANLEVGDEVEWVDRNDGSFILRKIQKTLTHDEMIAKGYTMTADGFWFKE